MAGYVQTVTGCAGGELGRTLMHEHILCDLRAPDPARASPSDGEAITMENRFEIDYFQNRNPLNMFLDEDDVAVRELSACKEIGGGDDRRADGRRDGAAAGPPGRLSRADRRSHVMGAG